MGPKLGKERRLQRGIYPEAKEILSHWFPTEVLDQVVLYFGFKTPWFLPKDVLAVTLSDKTIAIFIPDFDEGLYPSHLGLLAHELYHVMQYRRLGRIFIYFSSCLYDAAIFACFFGKEFSPRVCRLSPLERSAMDFQIEVLRWLGEDEDADRISAWRDRGLDSRVHI